MEAKIGSVRLSGVSDRGRAVALRSALPSAIGEQVAGLMPTQSGPVRTTLPNLKVQVPHDASPQDISRALGKAIADSIGRTRR
jgi:hypothetical protein